MWERKAERARPTTSGGGGMGWVGVVGVVGGECGSDRWVRDEGD